MTDDQLVNLLAHLHRTIEALEARVADLEADVAHVGVRAVTAAEELLAALASDVGLDGAACRGRAPLFDLDVDGESSDERDERHETAQRICGTCSVLKACTSLVPDLPPRTDGIWAGHLLTGRTPRPTKVLNA